MAMRVATFALNDRMLNASLKTQSRMAEMQVQQASGQVSNTLGGYGASGKSLVDLEVSLTRSQTYVASAQEAAGRVDVMYSAMDTINDLLASFRVNMTAVQSTSNNENSRKALSDNAIFSMQELATLLNTQYEGRYMFGGSATTTTPVDLANYTITDKDTPNTSFYQGNFDLASVQVSAEQSVNYGVSAADPAFEMAFRAFTILADADGVFDQSTLEHALLLMEKAVDGAASVQGKLAMNASSLERAISRELDFQSVFETSLSNIRDVDVASIAVKLTAFETQLQASYATMGKLSNLSLLDYLR